MPQNTIDLDVIIPVYNEGENIVSVLNSLEKNVRSRFRVLICYDRDDDTTLKVLNGRTYPFEVAYIKNSVKPGPHGAIMSGFQKSHAPAVIVMPADDDFNAGILDSMVAEQKTGADLVSASRFIPGGCMEGCPWLKFVLVRAAAFGLKYLAFLPVHDATNGFRLFSRRVLNEVTIESTSGFTYSIELLVKCHRLGWKIKEVPAKWYQRQAGTSRFKLFKWLGPYLYWFFYGFATTYLRRGPASVVLKKSLLTTESGSLSLT